MLLRGYTYYEIRPEQLGGKEVWCIYTKTGWRWLVWLYDWEFFERWSSRKAARLRVCEIIEQQAEQRDAS